MEKQGMQCGDRIGVILPNWSEYPMIQFGLYQEGVMVVPVTSTTASPNQRYQETSKPLL